MSSQDRVCVVGLWHLGCVYAACLAKMGYSVIGADEDLKIVENLKRGKPPIYEPRLNDLIAAGLAGGNLTFTRDIEEAAKDASYVVVAYDTPVDENDNVDPTILFNASRKLQKSRQHATFVVSSQVPVGTCQQLASMLKSDNGGVDLAYVPENLRLGQAMERFLKPEFLVIGAETNTAIARVRALFKPIQTRVIEMNLCSAEMTKHALNAFLSTSISFGNEIGNICDLVGADALSVVEALRCDSRIGPKAMLRPGLGFSGGTLARDLRILQRIGKKHGYETELVNAVLTVNERQNASIFERLKRIVGNLEGKSIGVLGLTYKAGTNTLRRSAALAIVNDLGREGASVKVFDPHAVEPDFASKRVLVCGDAYSVCKDSDVLLILNDWPDFANLDFTRVRLLMRTPILFDAQNVLDPKKVTDSGIRYIATGRGFTSTPE